MSKPKRNRSAIWTIVIIIAAVILVGVAFAGKNYYDSRYTGSIYYAQVPEGAHIEVQDIMDAQGKPQDKGYEYHLVGYDEEGNSLDLDFTVLGNNVDDLYAPGTYVRAEANAKIVVFQEPVPKDQVPASVLQLLSR